MFKWLIAFLYSLRRRRRLVLTAAAGSYALTLGSIRRHLRFGVGGGDYRLLGMTVRLTHTKRSERNLSLDAATGYLVAFGYPASLLRGLLLQITDDIPFSLIGYPVVLSKKPPVWSSTLSYTLDEGEVVEATALPVSVPGGGNPFITVSWDSSSVPSTKPDWITLTSGTTPTIAFTGGQTAADDVSSMVITATANGQSVNCTAGAVTVIATDVSWDGTESGMNVTFIQGTAGTYDLTQHVTNWDADLYAMEQTAGTDLSLAGVTLSTDGVLTYNGTAGTNIIGGVQVTIGNDAEADWLARISDPNVVWYHDFRSDAEVNAFRWTGAYGGGNDPNALGSNGTYCRRITTDGIDAGGGQGCLEIVWPSSGQYGNSYWWRPLSPLTGASNGRGVDDPAANNTITRRTMIATDGGSQTAQFIYGYYGDPNYQSLYPGQFDGNDYYLQVRVKMDPARITAGLNPGGNQFGKIFYLTRTDTSLTSQEINTESYQPGYNTRNYFSMYRSGSPPLESDTPGMGNQPGGTAGVVWFDNRDGSANNAFYWPSPAKWVTLLYYIKPMITESNATVVRVWKAVAGETSYTKIWDQTTIPLPYGAGKPYGHNALIFCSYQNQLVAANGFYHRMAQVIFKKGDGTGSLSSGIACPNDPVQRGEA